MKEAKEGYADWEHWDIQTILRFSEFVYTGDYQEPVVPGRAGQISSTEHNDLLLEPPVEPEPVLRTRKERSSRPCWDSFKRLYPDPQPKSSQNVREEAADFGEVLLSDVDIIVSGDMFTFIVGAEEQTFLLHGDVVAQQSAALDNLINSGMKESVERTFQRLYPEPPRESIMGGFTDDHTDMFVSIAMVYVFADCYGIKGLQELSLRKLREALVQFDLHPPGVPDITELIRYTYENTMERQNGQRDALRSLISLYAACKVKELMEDEEFPKLLDELGGDFSRALVEDMMGRFD
ncbi:hypothetical protein CkaCkLH20_08492 [Colletotrichum karsti]|uniref:BTB domain-containing protein n=1 Tax=Colletotrichum karsti TaxID=1095194 RepID=A0A9P6I8R9_9PEZI|nr:uncharacterized protein CkaCkLH20_08492 [Colletotrichum karsti]KAF9874120.1 hypothetical protein CkaCkLH20_08492 [Colletotrichum karsti]